MSKLSKLDLILKSNKGYITTKDVSRKKISRTYFMDYVKANNLKRVAQGMYVDPSIQVDEMFVIQSRYPEVIFSHETAAYLLGLSEKTPKIISITLASNTSSSRLNKEGIKVYKIKADLFELGVIKLQTPLGNIVRVYDYERTLADLVRSRNKVDLKVFQTYLNQYMSNKYRNIPKLMYYSKHLSITNIISDYLKLFV